MRDPCIDSSGKFIDYILMMFDDDLTAGIMLLSKSILSNLNRQYWFKSAILQTSNNSYIVSAIAFVRTLYVRIWTFISYLAISSSKVPRKKTRGSKGDLNSLS